MSIRNTAKASSLQDVVLRRSELEPAVASGEIPERSGAVGRWVKRKSGSCRFSPYFKLEWFDATLCVWRPLQKTFATIELADGAKDAGRKWRVFEVSEAGRRLLQ